MNKVKLLARVLRKVGSGKEEQSKSQYAGDSSKVLYVFLTIVLVVAMAFAGSFVGGFAGYLGGTCPIFRTILLLCAIMLLVLSLLDLVGTLYMSTDLPALICLPFTARQIVLARTLNACRTKMLIAAAAILPFGISYGLTCGITSVLYWAGLVLSALCVPVTCVAAAAVVIILFMSVFHFVRNRDVLTIIGGLFAVGFAIAYSVLVRGDTKIDSEKARQVAGNIIESFSGMAVIFPVIPLLADLMKGGPLWLIPAILAITAAYALVFILISDRLYLKSALSMQDTGTGKGRMDLSGIGKASAKHGVSRAITVKDIRCLLRNPAYLTNGWLMTLLWPVLILIGLLSGNTVSDFANAMKQGVGLARTVTSFGLCTGVAILASCSAACLSCASVTVLNREGASYYYIKMLPVSYAKHIRAKRNAALAICSVGSVGYVFLAGAVGAVMGLISPVWALYALVVTATNLALLVNIQALYGLRKPNLNWESEATIAKSNFIGIVIWFVGLIASFALIFFSPFLAALAENGAGPAGLTAILIAASCGIPAILGALAFWTDRMLGRSAEKRISAL